MYAMSIHISVVSKVHLLKWKYLRKKAINTYQIHPKPNNFSAERLVYYLHDSYAIMSCSQLT